VSRIRALLSKELADLRRHPGVFIPAALTGLVALSMPFVLAIGIPYFTGEPLSSGGDAELAAEMYRDQPAARLLTPEGAIQAWIFQQFIIFLALAPVAASMAIAAHSVIGEKQARTLEPLLATPISTFELLIAKVLSSFLPAVVLTTLMAVVYLAGIAALAADGVARALLSPAPLLVMFVVAPLAALAALQLAVCVSSRVNDARAAQQIGALVILPIAVLLVLQLLGMVRVTAPLILMAAAGLVFFNGALLWIGVALFERESILTRWK
jgi:ABC-2 type transport system permease protein